MNKTALLCLALLCTGPLLATQVSAQSQDRYISDVLHVPLRSGKGNEFRIVHRGLVSGTRLAFIREEPDASGENWSLVRTPDGEEGWIRSQFVVSEPVASLRVAAAERRVTDLDNRRLQLQRQVNELRTQNTELQEQLQALQESHEQVSTEAERIRRTSASALDLQEQYRELTETYQLLQTRADVMQAENQLLKKDRRYYDWLFGGGILILGVILSLLLQAIGRRKRRSEWR